MKKPSRVLKIVTALIAIFVGSVFIDSWFLEPNRINQVCETIHTGSPTSDVFTKAEEFNIRLLETRPNDKEVNYITLHGGSFGGYVCEIQHDGSHVVRSEFKKINVRLRPKVDLF